VIYDRYGGLLSAVYHQSRRKRARATSWLRHGQLMSLWTFVEHEGVEPTNDHVERELRAFVLWRKGSFETQSERGAVRRADMGR